MESQEETSQETLLHTLSFTQTLPFLMRLCALLRDSHKPNFTQAISNRIFCIVCKSCNYFPFKSSLLKPLKPNFKKFSPNFGWLNTSVKLSCMRLFCGANLTK